MQDEEADMVLGVSSKNGPMLRYTGDTWHTGAGVEVPIMRRPAGPRACAMGEVRAHGHFAPIRIFDG